MKYICFPFRLQCFLPQFTDTHSANFMLYCIPSGYGNLHTLLLHRCCKSDCARWQKMTQWCAATTPVLCLQSLPRLWHPQKYSSIWIRQDTLYRITQEDGQCSNNAENRVYAFRGQGCVPSSCPPTPPRPIPENLIHGSTFNSCVKHDSEGMLRRKTMPIDVFRNKIGQIHIPPHFLLNWFAICSINA